MELFNTHTRPTQVWLALLILAAMGKTMGYRKFTRKYLGYPNATGMHINHWLGWIAHYCHANGLPLLNELAVSKNGGQPGGGAPNLYGRSVEDERAKILAFDWLSIVPPTAEELRAFSLRLVA